jgi:UDP-N-acetyl-D-galactosamine dehydrogenase
VKKLYNSTRNGVYADEAAATLEEKLSQQDVLVDVKGIFDRKGAENMNFLYWRL